MQENETGVDQPGAHLLHGVKRGRRRGQECQEALIEFRLLHAPKARFPKRRFLQRAPSYTMKVQRAQRNPRIGPLVSPPQT